MNTGTQDRDYWVGLLDKITRPILSALAGRGLKATMPVEVRPGSTSQRGRYAHLEAISRLLAGIAPWLELGAEASSEGKLRADLLSLAIQGIESSTDPRSVDFANFHKGSQPLVDCGFIAQALLRASLQLWGGLTPGVQAYVVDALKASRAITPVMSNWLLFSAMVEAFLCSIGSEWQMEPIRFAIQKHMDWYKGDGFYGDGPCLHFDYFNS